MDYKKEAKQLIELFFPVEEEDGVGETALIGAFKQIAKESREKALEECLKACEDCRAEIKYQYKRAVESVAYRIEALKTKPQSEESVCLHHGGDNSSLSKEIEELEWLIFKMTHHPGALEATKPAWMKVIERVNARLDKKQTNAMIAQSEKEENNG